MKKLLTVLLVVSMCLSFIGCGKSDAASGKNELPAPTQDENEKLNESDEELEQENAEEDDSQPVEDVSEGNEDNKSDALYHPTSRVVTKSFASVTETFEEELEYADDGSYTVKRAENYNNSGSDNYAIDYYWTYNEKGELTHVDALYFNAEFPDGYKVMDADTVQGYPASGVMGCRLDDSKDFDYLSNGYIGKDESGNIAFSQVYYLDIVLSGNRGNNYSFYSLEKGGFVAADRIDKSIKDISDLEWGRKDDGNTVYLYGKFTAEYYDTETRKNIENDIYPVVDVLKYNDKGLIESVETYHYFSDNEMLEVTLDNLGNYEPSEYVYYTYDDYGNVLQRRGRSSGSYEETDIYEYEGMSSNSSSKGSDDNSDKATSQSEYQNSIVGFWACERSSFDDEGEYYFFEDGTGENWIHPLCFKFDWWIEGDKVIVKYEDSDTYGEEPDEYEILHDGEALLVNGQKYVKSVPAG